MNSKGCRSNHCLIKDTVPAFHWRNWRTSWQNSIRIVDVLNESWTSHVPNKSPVDMYHYFVGQKSKPSGQNHDSEWPNRNQWSPLSRTIKFYPFAFLPMPYLFHFSSYASCHSFWLKTKPFSGSLVPTGWLTPQFLFLLSYIIYQYFSLAYCFTLKREAVYSSNWTMDFHIYQGENLKFYREWCLSDFLSE